MSANTKEKVDYRDEGGYRQGYKKRWIWFNKWVRLHRVDGLPAVINDDGSYEWWVDGKQYPTGVDANYRKACDTYLHGISISGHLTKRATPT